MNDSISDTPATQNVSPNQLDAIVSSPSSSRKQLRNQSEGLPTVRVVVAHFNEKLMWLQALPSDYAITISYAGETPVIPVELNNTITIEKTKNGGKDCGQWIRWIAKHYDELDDIILFLQGNPYTGHTSEILLNISRNKLTRIFDYFLSKRPFNKAVGKGWQFGELTWIIPREFHVDAFSCGIWGSQHYVTKDVILRRPKSFYERLACISLELEGGKMGDICEHYFNVIYGVEMEEVE
jgi:hypothetical protein